MTTLLRKPRFAAIGAFAAMLTLVATSAYAAQDRHVRIINETEHAMVHFYASNVSVEDWQEDILGEDVLPAGSDVMINIDDGTGHCEYDFKAVFDDGEVLIRHDINVCKITSYRYSQD
jgi:hypothetical protein